MYIENSILQIFNIKLCKQHYKTNYVSIMLCY